MPTSTWSDCFFQGNGREMSGPEPDLLTRTSWVDAQLAYKQVRRGKLQGNACALWLRMHLQRYLYSLGAFIQINCGSVLFVGLLLLSVSCVGLKMAKIETNVEKLWVEEDGRLERELAYTEKILGAGNGITNELVIQTPKQGDNILTVDSLLLHQRALMAATKISVEVFDVTWKFHDICMAANFQTFENSLFEMVLGDILPCIIITPLDCFWEGSKLLGPEHALYMPMPLEGIQNYILWTNLNPQELVEKLAATYQFPEAISEAMRRAGVTTAYQEKPCLNPADPDCPQTAPNKLSQQAPDIGVELTGGCTGFATRYMQWEEDLIVGGTQKNKSGFINRAEALQSVIQLMGEKELYEYYRDVDKVLSIDWTQDKAKQVLETWQRRFTMEVTRITNETQRDYILPFSATSLLDILTDFSQVSIIRVAIGYIFMLVYACFSLMKWSNTIQSQSGIGIIGVLLVALSVAAGLGMCCVMGLHFNATTTQIIPFLALGLGVDDMFLLAHSYGESCSRPDVVYSEQTGQVLKRTGVSILLTSVSNMCAFFMAAIIPVPALRAFVLQAGILVLFNVITILVVFPAVVSLDMHRREEKRVDVFCCFGGAAGDNVIELQPPAYRERSTPSPPPLPPALPPPSNGPPPYSSVPPHYNTITHLPEVQGGARPITVLAPSPPVEERRPRIPFMASNAVRPSSILPSTNSSQQCLTTEEGMTCRDRCLTTQGECCTWSLTWFASHIYGPFLEKPSTKVVVVLLFLALFVLGAIGTARVEDGLELTDVVPKGTTEYQFLNVQEDYFGFYNMYAVTMAEFDYAYPENQRLLLEYHQSFQHIEKIIKKEDGTLPHFWLQQFRDWLVDLQHAFDTEFQLGLLPTAENWKNEPWNSNASDAAIFGYKLMVQTGDLDEPVDFNRLMTGRLVDDEGYINRDAFYNYLTAWSTNDALIYSASMALIHPLPKEWYHTAPDKDMLIPRSQPIAYAQIPFYLNNLGDTTAVTTTIKKIRDICDKFSERGLPNYPSGVPFTYWEQYINLRFYLLLALIAVLITIFIIVAFVLCNPSAAFIVVLVLAMMVVELFGFLGVAGIKLSAVPAVILIVAVGIGVEFTVHITLGFMTTIGTRNHRMRKTLEHMLAPVTHGAISTLLGVIMMAGAEFDFIVKYFFVVLTVLIFIGLLNGLILLPVLLSIFGPRSEVIPLDGSDHIQPPTPEPSPQPERLFHAGRRRVYPRLPSDISLSTITEEPTQYSSHEIIVHPEVVVETTIPGSSTNVVHGNGFRNSSPAPSSGSSSSSVHRPYVTTVKATAKVKVEVHTPIPGCVDQEHTYKSKRRKSGDDSSSESESRC